MNDSATLTSRTALFRPAGRVTMGPSIGIRSPPGAPGTRSLLQ